MIKLFLILISLFNLNTSNKVEPARLEKKEKHSIQLGFESTCEKIAPYVLVACIVIISVLLFIVLVKYGASVTGTEANHFYNSELA